MVERGDPRSGRRCLAGLFSRGQRWSLDKSPAACSRRLDQPAERRLDQPGRLDQPAERRRVNRRIGGGSSWVNRW